MRDPHALLNLILALQRDVRDEIVAASERQGLEQMASIDRDDEGDTIYAIDVVGETIVTRIAEALAHERTFVMVAEGLPGGRRVYPSGADEASADCCIIVDSHQRTNVRGVYAAGDVVLGLDQISHAMGEGGVAATTIRNDLAKESPLLR